MTNNNDHLPFAVDATGQVVSIFEVANGLGCNCHCPACNTPLIARQGKQQRWHFAHSTKINCSGGYESALHLAVKKIIEQERRILLPHCGVVCIPTVANSAAEPFKFAYSEHLAQMLVDGRPVADDWGFADITEGEIKFETIHVEQVEGDIRPDLIGVIGGRRLYIEVAVTHFVDDAKLAKIRSRGVAAIEIALPREKLHEQLDWDLLRKIVLARTVEKSWLFNPRAEKLALQSQKQRAESLLQRKESEDRKFITTHRIRFERFNYPGVVVLRMCGYDVSCVIEAKYSSELDAYLEELANEFGGKYGIAGRWIFPSNERLFFQLARKLKADGQMQIQGMIMPQDCDWEKRLGFINLE